MGMFGWVDFKTTCPKCGEAVDGFQTKDLHNVIGVVKPWECNNFYSSCDKCNTWIEYTRKPKESPEPPGWLDDFERKIGE